MSMFHRNRCEQSEVTCAYAAHALAASEVAAAEAHIASCADCRRELDSLRPVVDRLVSWPTDVLRSDDSAADAACASYRRGDRETAGAAAGAAVVRAGMGTGRARD